MLDRDYVVYTHNDSEGNVRYVGSGRLVRANARNARSSRGRKYIEWVENNGKLVVNIVRIGLTKSESIALEAELFEKYKVTGLLLNINKPKHIKRLPSREYLEKYLTYDENSASCLRWVHGKQKEAGSLNRKDGYYKVMLNKVSYLAHRLIVVLNGLTITESDVVDHRDNNTSNNKISNLRIVSQACNSRNRQRSKSNKNNFPIGVKLDIKGNRFIANAVDSSIKTKSGNSKKLSRIFSIYKYGFDCALNLAIQARKELLEYVENKNNITYSDSHKVICNS